MSGGAAPHNTPPAQAAHPPPGANLAALQGNLGNLFSAPTPSPIFSMMPAPGQMSQGAAGAMPTGGMPGMPGMPAAGGMPGMFPPAGATAAPSASPFADIEGPSPQPMPGAMPAGGMPGGAMPGGMPMMTPQQMANMNPQQLAQMQMMMQAQMQMMMQMQMQMGQQQPGAAGYPGQAAPSGTPSGSFGASQPQAQDSNQFNDLSADLMSKVTISDNGASAAAAPKASGGSPFDMFG